MRLLNCQLQNVRLHGDLEVAFSPRLTLIGGPNESGKSTLVEALHRALFLKATATGAPVEALQSRLHLGQPFVQIAFEARGDRWSLRKRFTGGSGQVTLNSEIGGGQFSGPAAEDQLAQLLGVGEMLGSKQATTVLPSRWAHLWVRQGFSGDDLLAAGKGNYDFDQLRLQLERSGGAAVQQSALDQQVEQRIEAALAENFTTRGTKKHSPLYQREEERNAATTRLAQAMGQLAEYENAGEELAEICEALETLQDQELPAVQDQLKRLIEGADAAARLDNAIELARQALEPIQLRHDAAAQGLQQLDGLGAEIAQRQSRLAELEANAAGAESQVAKLEAAKNDARQAWEGLNLQRQTLEKRLQLLQRLGEHTSTAESLQRLLSELNSLRQGASQRQALEQQLADLPSLTKKDLQTLRALEQQLRDARTRKQAMAAGVKLLKADQPVRLDGQSLEVGIEQKLSTVFQVEVGEGVVLEISPGGGQAQEELGRTVQKAAEQLAAGLKSLRAGSVEEAEELLERRTALEQQLAALAPGAKADLAQLELQKEGLEERLAQLDAELNELAETRVQMGLEQQLPQALSELQALQKQVNATSQHTITAAATAERDQESTRVALQQFQDQRQKEASLLDVVRGELLDRQQRIQEQELQLGNRQAMATKLGALGQERQQAETQLTALEAERAALGSQDRDRAQQQLQAQIDALTTRIGELLDQRGAAKQRCDTISATDPFAALEQAQLQLELAEADYRQLQQLTGAHQMLQALFQEAQADLSSRYSEPLARAIGDYLRPLVPDGQVARLSYDQSKGFQGLQLRRGQEYYDFGALSGGMREQLAAALRLSMADVLKDGHDGCLPLVFDDAFTNSDPERVDLVKRMLGTAVERGLQVILLTCDPAAYGSFADQVVELSLN